VGSPTCAACHREIYENFKRTSMGRSFGVISRDLRTGLPGATKIRSKSSEHSYRVYWEGADLYQSESFLDENGKPVSGPKFPAEYIVGSGMNGYTFLFRRGDSLFEEPISYYSRTRAWDLSPGFDAYDVGFARPIRTTCLECHIGRFAPEVRGPTTFPKQPFAEAAIGCENCHGPGDLHVRERSTGKTPSLPDDSIVNPAKLPLRLANNICIRCHQGNDARVLQPGKTISDFRPGTWLNETVAVFKVPLRRDQHAEESDLLEHGFAMMLSKCYRTSGSLACISCHAVHQNVNAEAKPAYYRSKCLTCHSTVSCSLDPLRRQPDDCVSCHMPNRAVPTISHTALTNHRIVSTPNEPYPDAAYSDSASESPGLIHVTSAPDPDHNRVAPITLLQAYRDLMVKAPQLRQRYLAVLSQLSAVQSDKPIVLAAAGQELLHGTGSDFEQAAVLLRKALELGDFDADVCMNLADALTRVRRFDEAIRVLKEGLAHDPYAPNLHKSLIAVTMKTANYAEAARAMSTYLRLYPDDNAVRRLLNEVRNMALDEQ
jgi:Tetratricopeptide repeat/Cytochrome c554 and c-prime